MNDEFFVGSCARCKLDALLDLAMRLQHGEDGELVQIIMVLLDKVEKLLLEDLDLLLLDQSLLAGILSIHLVFTALVDLEGTDSCNF